MKRIQLFNLIGIALIAMAQAVWAGPGGGAHGGGFGGGGGFQGGGFSGGGSHGGAPQGGRGSAGRGGISFGPGPNWTFKSRPFVRSSFLPGLRTPPLNESSRMATSTNRTRNSFSPAHDGAERQRSVAAVNRAPAVPVARSSKTTAQRGLNGRTDHIYARHDQNWHAGWDHRRAHFSGRHWWVFDGDAWVGLDEGFFPWDYYPYYAYDYYPYDYYPGYYADVQPYYNNEGVYDTNVPAPDSTVSAAQTRLIQLGYYNGPVDGIFGAQTRDALAHYQIDNQLNVTGSLSADTLQALGV